MHTPALACKAFKTIKASVAIFGVTRHIFSLLPVIGGSRIYETKLISRRVGAAANKEMNVTGFSGNNNNTFLGNQSVHQSNSSMSKESWLDWTTTHAVHDIILYVAYALGIPGNVLSAIVWLRRHVASENPSAMIYLAALAINDLVYLSLDFVFTCISDCHNDKRSSWSSHREVSDFNVNVCA